MDKLINRKFTTNEFAQMHNVNKKTLIYYDEIGLFKPAEVKKNGYRYYTLQQNFKFSAILLLRKMQIPLKEIKNYLEDYDTQTLLKLLHTHTDAIDEKIAELTWLKKIMQTKIENLETRRLADFNKIKIIKQKPKKILVSENVNDIVLEQAVNVVSTFIRNCYQNRLYHGASSGITIDANALIKEKQKKLINFFYLTTDEKESKEQNIKNIPEGFYLTAFYKGDWHKMDTFYEKIRKYIFKNNLKLAEHAYEEMLLDDIVTKDFNYTEIRFSILLK